MTNSNDDQGVSFQPPEVAHDSGVADTRRRVPDADDLGV